MPLQLRTAGGLEPRRNRRLEDRNSESYRMRRKPSAPNWCPECGAVFQDGRWQWTERASNAREERCPACLRVQDGIPAGFLRLEGEFFSGHTDEILSCVRNEADKVKAGHALQRIMGIARNPEYTLITTTDAHLARGLGETLRHAYKGDLELQYVQRENLVRVTWRR